MAVGNTRRVIVAGAIGNVLEWYDFAVYGYFAAAIGRAFFPQEDKVAQVLAAFGIFAVGFLMRPVGGALIGYIGDRFGRRAALTFSVAAMAIPTFLVGVLPGYAHAGRGRADPAHAPAHDPGPVGRRRIHDLDHLHGRACAARPARCHRRHGGLRCGRRHPRGFGDRSRAGRGNAHRGAGGLGLAHSVPARPGGRPRGLRAAAWHPGGGDRASEPAVRRCVDTLRHHGPLLLRLAALSVFNSVGFYLMFVYIVSWLQFADGMAPAQALEINTVSMVVLLPLIVAMGWLSDRIGRRPVLLGATVFAFVGAWPLFWLMHHPDPALVLLGQLGFALAGRHLRRLPARGHGRGRAPAKCAARRSRSATTSRWASSAGSARWSRPGWWHRTDNDLQPGLHDHGGRGGFLPRHPELQGNLSDAAREGLVNRTQGRAGRSARAPIPAIRAPPRVRARRAPPAARCRSRCAGG